MIGPGKSHLLAAATTIFALALPGVALANDRGDSAPLSPDAAIAALTAAGATTDGLPTGTPDQNSASVTENSGTIVDIPKDPHNGVTISSSSGDVTLGIPDAAGVDRGVRTKDAVLFTNPGTGVTMAAQALDDGAARMNFEIPDSNAPHDYPVTISLPDGAHPMLQDDGSIDFIDASGHSLGKGFKAPTAKDANGNPLPTWFKVDGDQVIQHINFDASTAFPIVADHWYVDVAKALARCAGGAVGFSSLETVVRHFGVITAAKFVIRRIGIFAAFGCVSGVVGGL